MKFPTALSDKLARPMLRLRKVSPQIMFGAGVIGVVSAGVLACQATLKIDETLEKGVERELKIKKLTSDEVEGFEADKFDKNMAHAKAKLILDLAKLYAPAVGVAVVSIGLLTGSHVTLTRRNTASMAAYAALNEAYGRYRGQVIDKYGKDEDDRLRHGVVHVEETIVNDDGKKKVVKRERSAGLSPYAQLFTEGNVNWEPNPNNNWFFLHSQQRYWNDHLQTHGFVFLNDVLYSLGFEKTKAGQMVGWVVGEQERDGYIDFGLGEDQERVRDFMDGGEGSCWIDFNVDGIVLDLAFA